MEKSGHDCSPSCSSTNVTTTTVVSYPKLKRKSMDNDDHQQQQDDDGRDSSCSESFRLVKKPCSVVVAAKMPEISGGGGLLKVGKWLDDFQTFTNRDKNLALTQLVSDYCNTSQLRLVRSRVEPFFQRDFISQLPKELSLKILSALSCRDLLNVSLTCRRWRQLSENCTLWQQKCPDWPTWFKQRPQVTLFDYGTVANASGLLTPVLTPKNDSPCLPTLAARCPPKAAFFRREKICSNWRRARPTGQITLRGHDDHVITCMQLFGDDMVVSGSDDNTLKVWTLADGGRCVHTLVGHTGGVWCNQVTSDGQLIVSGSTDRTVRVWETATGQCLHTLLGHTSTVRCMALKGDVLISGSRDGTLRAWNVRTGQFLNVFAGHVAAVRCVQFDGKRAVSGAYDFIIRVWDVERCLCLHTLIGHTNRVYSLQFDSDRNIVVSGSLDTSIRVWNILTGNCLFTLTGHQSLTSGMQLHGRLLISGNADSTLKVWDVETGRCLHTLLGPKKHTSAVTSLQLLPDYGSEQPSTSDGKWGVKGSGGGDEYAVASGLVATSSDDGTVKLWDCGDGRFLTDLTRLPSGGSGGCIWRLRATPTRLVCAVGSRNGTEDTKLLVYDFDADCP